MNKIRKLTLVLRCEYSDEELAERRDELSNTIIESAQVEDKKSDANKHFKEILDGLYSQSAKIAYQIKDRGEDRPVECAVEMNNPNVGEKTFIRLDTGEVFRTESMSEEERQEEIEFDLDAARDIQKLVEDAHNKNEPPADPPEAA